MVRMKCTATRSRSWSWRSTKRLPIEEVVVTRLYFAIACSCAATVLVGAQQRTPKPRAPRSSFTLVEATIPQMRAALEKHQITSVELVTQYFTRLALYEDKLHAALTVNPNAIQEADQRDQERSSRRAHGPLHGIPIAVKDNIQTTTMPTTGGALAFVGFVPPYEATLVSNLKAAGAIVIAKTGMTELANWMAGDPTPMPTNYNAVGGFGFNPYDPRRDPRPKADGRPALQTGGSSSGIGTAASLWAANVGTETSGSILSPSNQNMLVGIKPTVGRVSRYGVIPITADQDTPGPMTKTVADAAIMLGAMEGARPDPGDAATAKCPPPAGRDYTRFLNPAGLKGARIGIPRAFFYEPTSAGASAARGGLTPDQKKSMDEALAVLRAQGAIIVDPADIPSVIEKDSANNFLNWNVCSGAENAKGLDASCSVAFKYGMKRDFNAWLKTLGDRAPVKTLTELRQWNIAHQRAGAIKYGQTNLDASDEMDVAADRARYEADRRKDILLSATNGLDAVFKKSNLDALLF